MLFPRIGATKISGVQVARSIHRLLLGFRHSSRDASVEPRSLILLFAGCSGDSSIRMRTDGESRSSYCPLRMQYQHATKPPPRKMANPTTDQGIPTKNQFASDHKIVITNPGASTASTAVNPNRKRWRAKDRSILSLDFSPSIFRQTGLPVRRT